MSLADVLKKQSEILAVYAVEITAFKTKKFWQLIPVTGVLGYQTAWTFDGFAYITNVFNNGVKLVNVANQATVESTAGSWFWDRTNLFIRLVDDTNPSIETNTVTVELTYYFATIPKIFNGIYYQGLLKTTPSLSVRSTQDFSSGLDQINGGTTVLSNESGFFDSLTDLAWDAGQTTVHFGADQPQIGVTMDFSDYVTIGTWLNDSWDKTNQDFTLQNIERKYRLSQTVPQRLYSLSLYPNMAVTDIGRPIPLAYGKIFGAAPVCINVSTNRFKIADHRIFSIDEVRVSMNSRWDIINIGILDLLDGEFTLPTWDGTSSISVDFRGKTNSNGTWMDNVSDIVQDLLVFIGETQFNTDSFVNSHKKVVLGNLPNGAIVPALNLPTPISGASYVAGSASLDSMTGDFTIEGWIYQSQINTKCALVYNGLGANPFPLGQFDFGFLDGLDSKIGIQLNQGAFTLYGDVVPVGQWAHVACCRSGSDVTLWVNGIQSPTVGSYGTAISYSGGRSFRVGKGFQSLSFFGDMSEVRVSQICRYTTNFTPPDELGTDADTLIYWKLNEGTGTVVNDSSPSGISGTLNGNAGWTTRTLILEVAERVPSVYLDTPQAGNAVIQMINGLVGSTLFVDATGFYRYVVFEPVQGEGLQTFDILSILDFDENNPSLQEQSQVTAIFANRLTDGWGQYLTAEKVANQYSHGQPNLVTVGAKHINLSTQDDADYYVKRQLVFVGEKPKLYRVKLPWSALLLLPTDFFHLIYPRHSLDKILDVLEVSSQEYMISVVGDNFHNYNDQTGFWMEDSDVLPTRFANLAGYGGRTDGAPDGSIIWYAGWDPQIKSWARQNCGWWTEDDWFVDDTDESSYLASAWF